MNMTVLEFLSNLIDSIFTMDNPASWSLAGSVMMLLMLKIWRSAQIFRKEVVSVQDLNEFKAKMRSDMRYYKEEITDVVIKAAYKSIEDKLDVINDFKNSFIELEKLKVEIKYEFDKIKEQMSKVDVVSDNMKSLQNKVTRLDNNKPNSGVVRESDR